VVSYPGVASLTSTTAKVYFDYNYSRAAGLFEPPAVGPGICVALLVDYEQHFHDTAPGAGFIVVDLGVRSPSTHQHLPAAGWFNPERLLTVLVHDSANGVKGAQKWAGFLTDGSNAERTGGNLGSASGHRHLQGAGSASWPDDRYRCFSR
jgi:hypothetical protein